MECFREEYHSRHESLAKQVHDYFANDYVPRSDHLVDDIQNYCYQLPDIPNTAGLCTCNRPNRCVASRLSYQDFMSFLCYLAAKTIILMASGIRTQFKTFYYRKDQYILVPKRNYSRMDDSCNNIFHQEGREVADMVYMIERFHNEDQQIATKREMATTELPYETIIHRLYPLIKKYHCVEMNHVQSGRISYALSSASILWEYTYGVTLECESTRQRQRKLFRQAMSEIEYAPPCPGLLPNGGIQYQKGLERFGLISSLNKI